ncbi:BET1-like protein [Limulus polyphemus]|uniref:BET1-like protein n=1 Tax=Limulus polyphemus TaxID=6850 RepID=A0ABM1BNR8_LIMPO|nr:BET1-like protein [Limulus polyphemus]
MASRNGNGRISEELLEAQNRQMTENLSLKISHLKNISLDIEGETKEHNRLLNGLGLDFENSQGILSSSFNRVSKMIGAGSGNRRVMCYISLGLVGLFIVGYYIIANITK